MFAEQKDMNTSYDCTNYSLIFTGIQKIQSSQETKNVFIPSYLCTNNINNGTED